MTLTIALGVECPVESKKALTYFISLENITRLRYNTRSKNRCCNTLRVNPTEEVIAYVTMELSNNVKKY